MVFLKKLNIYLRNVKLCDFGLSRKKQKKKRHMGRVGTPNWMAPEIFR